MSTNHTHVHICTYMYTMNNYLHTSYIYIYIFVHPVSLNVVGLVQQKIIHFDYTKQTT